VSVYRLLCAVVPYITFLKHYLLIIFNNNLFYIIQKKYFPELIFILNMNKTILKINFTNINKPKKADFYHKNLL